MKKRIKKFYEEHAEACHVFVVTTIAASITSAVLLHKQADALKPAGLSGLVTKDDGKQYLNVFFKNGTTQLFQYEPSGT